MNNLVVLKHHNYGFTIKMDPDAPFEDVLAEIRKKFSESSKFFKSAKIGIAFDGRELTEEEERCILNNISDCSSVEVVCILTKDAFKEEVFKQAVEATNKPLPEIAVSENSDGQFYRGTLRSGQVFEAEDSVVILGDVNPGATVISTGNIVVLGSLKGFAFAGCNGKQDAFIVAMEMLPVQLRIGTAIARCSDDDTETKKKKKKNTLEPKIAFVENEMIYIEPVSREIIHDMSINS